MKKISAFKCEHCGTLYEYEDSAAACESVHSRELKTRELKIVDAEFSKSQPIPVGVLVEVSSESGRKVDAIWYYK